MAMHVWEPPKDGSISPLEVQQRRSGQRKAAHQRKSTGRLLYDKCMRRTALVLLLHAWPIRIYYIGTISESELPLLPMLRSH